VSQKARSTFVLVHPTEILQALVGLKDVEVLRYERRGSSVELMVEQVPGVVVSDVCTAGPGQRAPRQNPKSRISSMASAGLAGSELRCPSFWHAPGTESGGHEVLYAGVAL